MMCWPVFEYFVDILCQQPLVVLVRWGLPILEMFYVNPTQRGCEMGMTGGHMGQPSLAIGRPSCHLYLIIVVHALVNHSV